MHSPTQNWPLAQPTQVEYGHHTACPLIHSVKGRSVVSTPSLTELCLPSRDARAGQQDAGTQESDLGEAALHFSSCERGRANICRTATSETTGKANDLAWI